MLGAVSDILVQGVVLRAISPELEDRRAEYRACNEGPCGLVGIFCAFEADYGER